MPKPRAALSSRLSRSGPFTPDAVNRQLKRIGWRAGFGFPLHVHMLRHGCGYALANAGHDTRAIQDWLGHRSIQHTVRYTELAPTRFKGLLAGLALFRRVVGSVKGRSRKTKAHLLPVRKSDVGGTWLVDDTGLGFLLDVREGAGRGRAARRLLAGRPAGRRDKSAAVATSSTLRKGRARASREEHCREEHCRQDRRQFHDCARLYYSLVPLIGRTANDKACRDRMKRQK